MRVDNAPIQAFAAPLFCPFSIEYELSQLEGPLCATKIPQFNDHFIIRLHQF